MKYDASNINCDLPDYKMVLSREISHLHYELDTKIKKSNTIQWVKNRTSNNVKGLIDLPEYEFEAIGKYAYILNNGAKLDEKTMDSFTNFINLLCEKTPITSSLDGGETNKPTIQDYVKTKAANTCQLFDSWVDHFSKSPESYNFDVKKTKSNMDSLKPAHHKHIADHYKTVYDEITAALDGDEGLYEGYAHFTKSQLRKLHTFYKLIFDSMVVAVDATPPKKPVDVFKVLSKLKYRLQEGDIKSVSPKLILGAKELWIFNVKSNKLGVYMSDDGFSVNGSNIVGFNGKSVEKMVKKDFDLKQFQIGNQAFKNNQFKSLTSIDVKMNGKISDQHLLLATY